MIIKWKEKDKERIILPGPQWMTLQPKNTKHLTSEAEK